MEAKTEVVRARVSHRTKDDAEKVLKKLGLTMSEVINLMLVQISLNNGLPFEIKVPNDETIEVFEQTDKGLGLKMANDIDDLFDQIGV